MAPPSNIQSLPVLLLAGRRPGVDPIASYFGTDYKVLAPVAGKPMIVHTLKSLQSMDGISDIFVLGQEPDELQSRLGGESLTDKVSFVKSEPGIADTILTAINQGLVRVPFLVITSDNCLIQQGHVDDFLKKSEKLDAHLVLGMVEKSNLVQRYPESRRTWLNFRDVSVTGCNLFLFKDNSVVNLLNYWRSFESSPKRVIRLAWSIGPLVFLKYLLKKLTLHDSFGHISARVGTIIKPVQLSNPDIAIDADKISDIVQIESILKLRERNANQESRKNDNKQLVIFDLDRTITVHGTFLPFLIYYAVRTNPLRLSLLPLIVIFMLLYLAKLICRKQLKTLMQMLLMGSVNGEKLDDTCDGYVQKVFEKKVNLDALLTIRRWHASGARLVLATASFDWMARAFSRRLGFNEIIASVSIVKGNKVLPGIEGENCYGEAKLAMIEKSLGSLRGYVEADTQVWFYTDHHSDIPVLERCSRPVAVNPSAKLRQWAQGNSWSKILNWSSKTINSTEQFINETDGSG
jgi:HAD superfamily phosphoserine phosphatase-like hydrolase